MSNVDRKYNAVERYVSAVLRDVLSVSDSIVICTLLTAVSTLEGLDVNDELPTSDVNPDVVYPKSISSEDIVYTELI